MDGRNESCYNKALMTRQAFYVFKSAREKYGQQRGSALRLLGQQGMHLCYKRAELSVHKGYVILSEKYSYSMRKI